MKGIDLVLEEGKFYGLLGPNGAGKTTTIRMLASIIAPSSGTLTMNGVDAVKNHRWVKERINVISGGERNLYWRLTAIENLKYFGSLYGLSGVKLKEKITEVLSYNEPVICEVMCIRDQPIVPMVSSKRLPDGRMVSTPIEDMYPFLDRKEFLQNMIVKPVEEE